MGLKSFGGPILSHYRPQSSSPLSNLFSLLDMTSNTNEYAYQPAWDAPSIFTPSNERESPAVFTPEMATYFSSLLKRKVIGVDEKLVGSGVYHVVRICDDLYTPMLIRSLGLRPKIRGQRARMCRPDPV